MRQVRITSGEYSFLAQLEEEKAPKTCAAFLEMLPLREKAIHVRWSGEGIWIPYGEKRMSIPFENNTSHPSKGEVLLYPGGISEMEIVFPYGWFCFASTVGQLAGNHFMTIKDDLDRFGELGRKVLWEGAQKLRIELVE